MRDHHRTAGVSLTEVLVSAAILASLALGGIVITDTAKRTASDTNINRSLTQDARQALNAIKDDLRAASREGSVADPQADTTSLRSDPDRAGSITLHLDPAPNPSNAITYYLDTGTLYRAYRTTLTPLARNAQALAGTVEGELVTITLTLQHDDQERRHETSLRFRNP